MKAKTDWASLQLLYGITPPKVSSPEERRREIADAQAQRINQLPVDGLIVYDLQDESTRTKVERPFPFVACIDPFEYAYDYLGHVSLPKIVYRSVSIHAEAALSHWLTQLHERQGATVLVGAPADDHPMVMKIGDAYKLRRAVVPTLPLGGVVIAERHEELGGEDERVLRKVGSGCEFFVSQAVYSVTKSKNLLSDLYYNCQRQGLAMPRIYITLSPCGSAKTLEFVEWLGVHVPSWLKNELLYAGDILEKSIELSVSGFAELHEFAQSKGFKLGCNVESVSLRKAEIDASVEMVQRIRPLLG
jgi:hypothetical protein